MPGRRARHAREFLLEYQDRILYGSDVPMRDPRQQLGEGKRFDQIVLGSEIEPGDPILDGVPGGEEEDGWNVAARCV